MIPVINGIEEPAKNQMLNVGSPTVVIDRDVVGPIGSLTVQTKGELNDSIACGQHFRRKGVWGSGATGCSQTALWTETTAPIPRPPEREFLNHGALDTIQHHPALFKVSKPIKVDVFESLLVDHPNQPFVHSVCTGLREGLALCQHSS
jgi:hypothetical protein